MLYLVFHVVMYRYMIDSLCNGRVTVSQIKAKNAFLEIYLIHKRSKYRVTPPPPPKKIYYIKNKPTR